MKHLLYTQQKTRRLLSLLYSISLHASSCIKSTQTVSSIIPPVKPKKENVFFRFNKNLIKQIFSAQDFGLVVNGPTSSTIKIFRDKRYFIKKYHMICLLLMNIESIKNTT